MDYSVLMSVYYKENPDNLVEAMESVWNQSIPTDNFILVCDGPLTPELDLKIYEEKTKHPGLKIIRLKKNVGLGRALNVGLKHCKNELVVRMDSDDISFSNRCEKQLLMFKRNPELAICSGTVLEFVDSIDNITGKRKLPKTNEEIRIFSKKRNPFNHPAVMLKKSEVLAAGGYSERFHLFEDYYLWIRMLMKGSKARNIDSPLVYMRTSKKMYLRRGGKAYAKDMLLFHNWMRVNGWTTAWTFLTGAVPHALVCILPNIIRRLIYIILR